VSSQAIQQNKASEFTSLLVDRFARWNRNVASGTACLAKGNVAGGSA